MQVVTYGEAESFLRDSQTELEKREAEHNLILGLALGLRGSQPVTENASFFARVQDTQGLLVAALMTSSNSPLVLSTIRPDGDQALALIIGHLIASEVTLSGVVGPNGVSKLFAQRWSRVSGQPAQMGMRQRLYKLTHICEVPIPSGEFRRARNEHHEVVGRWIAAFNAEALQEGATEEAGKAAKQRIDRGEIYLWEDSEPRSMAAHTRTTSHGIAINAVYTPPEWRRQGLATACVARLSEYLLNSGYSFCVLFTDLANPTSNSIYQRIGYQPVGDFAMYRFGERSCSHRQASNDTRGLSRLCEQVRRRRNLRSALILINGSGQ